MNYLKLITIPLLLLLLNQAATLMAAGPDANVSAQQISKEDFYVAV